MNQDKLREKLIEELGNIKIDHTDFDDKGFNRLCSGEINKIMDIFQSLFTQEKKELIKKIKKYKCGKHKKFINLLRKEV